MNRFPSRIKSRFAVLSLAALAAAAAVLALSLVSGPGRAMASSTELALFEENSHLLSGNPTHALATLRLLGVDEVRVILSWREITRLPLNHHKPQGFNGADPASYPSGRWTAYDRLVRDAATAGIKIQFDLTGGAPLWATGSGAPRAGSPHWSWKPSVREFGAFVHAVGERYSGNYDPQTNSLKPGNPSDLPAVRSWSSWNEPDYGPSLSPQGLPGNTSVEYAPYEYRNLLDATWTQLGKTGHGHDTILFGEVAPRGKTSFGLFQGIKPLQFVRALYCVDANYHELRGSAASERGCPTTAAASRRFASQHPALFKASGFADHPYTRWYPPDVELQSDPDYSSLPEVWRLERALDRVQQVYGSHRKLPIYDTEYGYITSPPQHETSTNHFVPPNTAAYYLNWAEYLHWKDPRIVSYDQYLLYDPRPPQAPYYGGFASGLLSFRGGIKPTYYAYRLPLYLPVTNAKKGQAVEVWGCIRAAKFAIRDTGLPQSARLQFEPAGGGSYTTLRTITVSDPSKCYFDLRLTLPSSGTLRLSYTYPASDPLLPENYTVYSRHVQVTVK